MNITFVDHKPEVKKEEVIVVGGEEVGYVREKKKNDYGSRFHAGINFKGRRIL